MGVLRCHEIKSYLEALKHTLCYNNSPLKGREVKILDTTLREGEQAPSIYFSLEEKLAIAEMLDRACVDMIEISPVVSEEHEKATKQLVEAGFRNAEVIGHVRALKSDVDVAVRCGVGWVALYMSISDIHLKYKLGISRDEALKRIRESVSYAKKQGLNVRFSLEDASRADPEFLRRAAVTAVKAGADRLSVTDTLGVMTPKGMYRLVKLVREAVEVPLDVHCHNDMGLALANSIAGLEAGADQIHVSVNGIGERAGITSLSEAVIALRFLYGARVKVKTELLSRLSNLVAKFSGIPLYPFTPLVGECAFTHKAGTHIAAVLKNPASYEPIPPGLVGNKRRILFGVYSGKNAMSLLASILGLNVNGNGVRAMALNFKRACKGDVFGVELDEGSIRLLPLGEGK